MSQTHPFGIRKTMSLLLAAPFIVIAPALCEDAAFAEPPAGEKALPPLKPHREPVLASPEETKVAVKLGKPIRAGEFAGHMSKSRISSRTSASLHQSPRLVPQRGMP
jgi:hypothetical protein